MARTIGVPVRTRYERVKEQANGKGPGAVHITVNGQPCKMWSRDRFRNHPGGIEQVSFATMVMNICQACKAEGERGLVKA